MDTLFSLNVITLVFLNIGIVCGQVAPVFLADYPTTYDISDTLGTGQSVALVIITDTDAGVTVTSLTLATNTYFELTSVVSGTARIGTVKTHASTALTGGSRTTQTLNFVALDASGLTASRSYNITISNTSPTLTLPSTAVVSDTVTTETLVYTITCTDPTDTVSSSVVSVNPSNSPKSEFFFVQKIPTTSNYGVYARSQTDASNGVFNYNRQLSYVVTIQCTDGKSPVTRDLTVYIQQNQPPIANLPVAATTNVATTVASGHTVFTVTATDNENDAVSFTFACSPTGCPFTLTSASSTTAVLTTTVALSTLTSTSDLGYDITITPLDAKNTGTSRVLTVLITGPNNAPTFSNLNNAWTVYENTAVGSTVFTVSSADADTGDTVTLSFTSDPTSGTSLFEMDTSGHVKIKSALNYEALTNTTYILTVLASDTMTTSTGTLTLLVADVNEPLTWNSANYRADVSDGAAVGTTVTVTDLAVTDPDANETLTCKMSCTPAGYFSMSTSCTIKVTSVYSLDMGLANTVTCIVNGTDNGDTNTATTTLLLDIVDVNNYSPVFEESGYTFDVSPYESSGFTLGRVNATDADTGTFGQVSYSLNQTLTGTYFSIHQSTGVVSTAVSMATCSCSGSTIAVPVYATDTGGRIGTSTVYVTLSVTTTTPSTTTTESLSNGTSNHTPVIQILRTQNRHSPQIQTNLTTATHGSKTFLEDSKNSAWFAVFLATAAITAIVTGYVLYNFVFGPLINSFTKRYEFFSTKTLAEMEK